MNDSIAQDFQNTVQDLLIRNKSLLDTLTKFQDTTSRVNRALIKAATHCGCITIKATKQGYPIDMDYETLHNNLDTHVRGELCDHCLNIIKQELGMHMFYFTSICNAVDIDLGNILEEEKSRMDALGKFSMR